MRRLLCATAVAGLLGFVGAMAAPAGAAWAHSTLVRTDPAAGSVARQQVTAVALTFSENVRARGSTITVTGPDGTAHGQGAVSVVDTTISQPTSPLGPGRYQVVWRVTSADGDPVRGEFGFSVDQSVAVAASPAAPAATASSAAETAAAGPDPTDSYFGADPQTAASSDSSLPWVGVGVLAVLLVGVGGWLAVRQRR